MNNSKKDYVITPGQTILTMLESNNMTTADLSKVLATDETDIEKYITGEERINTYFAASLEAIFNIPATFWINLDTNYRRAVAWSC